MSIQARRVSSLFVTAPVLLCVGAVLFPALLYRQRDLTILCFLVFGIIGSLRLWGSAGLIGLTCTCGTGKRRMFPGENFAIHVDAENRKILPVWTEVMVPFGRSGTDRSNRQVLSKERGILWYQGSRFTWELTAGNRGVYRVGPVRLMSGDFFGFFPKEKETAEALEVVVYPRLVPLKNFSLSRRDFFGAAGAESPIKDPVYMLGTTDYHHGRPARFIHWKASARQSRLQEKVFEASGQEKVLIIVDVEGLEGEAFERTLEAASSLAVNLDRKGVSVGALTNGIAKGWGRSYLRITRREAQLSEILELFARLEAGAGPAMPDLLAKGLSLPYGVSCIYFAFEEAKNQRAAIEKLKGMRLSVTPVIFGSIGRLIMSGPSGECRPRASDQPGISRAGTE